MEIACPNQRGMHISFSTHNPSELAKIDSDAAFKSRWVYFDLIRYIRVTRFEYYPNRIIRRRKNIWLRTIIFEISNKSPNSISYGLHMSLWTWLRNSSINVTIVIFGWEKEEWRRNPTRYYALAYCCLIWLGYKSGHQYYTFQWNCKVS